MGAEEAGVPFLPEPVALAADVQHVAVMQQPDAAGLCRRLQSVHALPGSGPRHPYKKRGSVPVQRYLLSGNGKVHWRGLR